MASTNSALYNADTASNTMCESSSACGRGWGEGPPVRQPFTRPHRRRAPPGLPRKRGRREFEEAARRLPACLRRRPHQPSSHLREGLGEGRPGAAAFYRAIPSLAPSRPPSQAGEEKKRGSRPVISLPAHRGGPISPPPACGRGRGRVLRCGSLLSARTTAGSFPASPASGEGEESRQPHRRLSSRSQRRTHRPPFACRRGWGRVTPAQQPFTGPHRRRTPPGLPCKRGRRRIEAAAPPPLFPLAEAALSAPLPLAGGVGGGSSGAAAFLPGHTVAGPLPASPASGGGEKLRQPPAVSLPAPGNRLAVSPPARRGGPISPPPGFPPQAEEERI